LIRVTIETGIRLLLVGKLGGELHLAAAMAREAGADVVLAAGIDDALAIMRTRSVGLVMFDVMGDIAGFLARLRLERFAVPVLACGIDAPADRAVAAIRAGARDYVPLPPERALIAAALTVAAAPPATRIVGEDAGFRRAVDYACRVAPAAMPVLIVGEPGTGRALLARAIHAASGRTGAFLTVECGGVAAPIVEAELFGHRPGELPGVAAGRLGRLEEARGGTLFIRDIDRLSATAQARLMAVLPDGGAVRLIASASRDPAALAEAGEFRADLAARLGTAQVVLPPLRARGHDMVLIAQALVAGIEGAPRHGIDRDAALLLAAHSWPCNVRELEDVVRRAAVLARGSAIAADDLVLADGTRLDAAIATTLECELAVDNLIGRTVEDVERALILKTLERCRGNRTSASGILGISVRTMRNKLKTFVEAGIAVMPAA
jgi:DNA-binding NtrC family response regulator